MLGTTITTSSFEFEACSRRLYKASISSSRHVYGQLSPEQMQHLKEKAFIEVKIGQQVYYTEGNNYIHVSLDSYAVLHNV